MRGVEDGDDEMCGHGDAWERGDVIANEMKARVHDGGGEMWARAAGGEQGGTSSAGTWRTTRTGGGAR